MVLDVQSLNDGLLELGEAMGASCILCLRMLQRDPIDKRHIDSECVAWIMEVNLLDGPSGRNIFRA